MVTNKADVIQRSLDSASEHLSEVDTDVFALGPRWRLLERGEDIFVKALKPFSGQRVTVMICGNDDGERSGFEQLLINFLREAKWDSPEYSRWEGCPGVAGNQIYFVSATDDSAEWADLPVQQWLKVEGGRFNISHDASNTLCDVLYKLGIYTHAFREKALPKEIGMANAMAIWDFGVPGGPAEMAYKDPGRIFILVGSNSPIFSRETKPVNKTQHK